MAANYSDKIRPSAATLEIILRRDPFLLCTLPFHLCCDIVTEDFIFYIITEDLQ
jgi:hypothetical protein